MISAQDQPGRLHYDRYDIGYSGEARLVHADQVEGNRNIVPREEIARLMVGAYRDLAGGDGLASDGIGFLLKIAHKPHLLAQRTTPLLGWQFLLQ